MITYYTIKPKTRGRMLLLAFTTYIEMWAAVNILRSEYLIMSLFTGDMVRGCPPKDMFSQVCQ
jgi:hypothetical protein